MASDTIVRMSDIFIVEEEDIVIDNIAEDIMNEPCEPEIIVEQPNNYIGTFEGTWYCATDMGYSTPPYGSSGRTLETGYSVASNYFRAVPYFTLRELALRGLTVSMIRAVCRATLLTFTIGIERSYLKAFWCRDVSISKFIYCNGG